MLVVLQFAERDKKEHLTCHKQRGVWTKSSKGVHLLLLLLLAPLPPNPVALSPPQITEGQELVPVQQGKQVPAQLTVPMDHLVRCVVVVV